MAKGPSQQERILEILRKAHGNWVCGQYFNDPPVRISQYHTRIFELQQQGYVIEASTFKNEYGFKSYKLISEPGSAQAESCCVSMRIFGTHGSECPLRNQKPVQEEIKQATLL